MTTKASKGPQGFERYSDIPEETRQQRAWCPFRFELRDGKRTKIPYNAKTGRRARSNAPKTWSTFEEAYEAAASSDYDGVEYILSGDDSYFLLDLDGCRNAETGKITPEARRIIAPFAGKAFIEISTSGRGIHVFGRGTKPGAEWCRRDDLGIELYDWGRPVVFTGDVLEGSTSELEDCQEDVDRLYFEYMPEHLKDRPGKERETSSEPVDLPDEKLLQKAATSRYGDEFRALWAGDTSITGGNHSTADYRLMKTLMFWTGGDEARAIELFDRSGLARRDKWRRRPDYRDRTARRARMACTGFYQKNHVYKESKQEQLTATVEELRRRWWEYDWACLVGTGERPNSMRGHSCRDVMKVIVDATAKHGEVSEDGVRVSLGRRTISLKAATSLRTVHKAIGHLEAEGWLKFEPSKSQDKPGTYVMRATFHHNQDLHMGIEREGEPSCVEWGGEELRAPRLRWSSPGCKARRGVDKKMRRVRDKVQPARDSISRLGKCRGAVVDALEASGGSATLQELCDALRRSRPRDVRRRMLLMLESSGIIVLDGDIVSLSESWLDRVEEARELGGEVEREKLERERHRKQREAFRRRHENRPDEHYVNAGADGYVEDLRPSEFLTEESTSGPLSEPEISKLARAIRDYLDRNPADACQPPGWIGATLWAYELCSGKLTPTAVRAAIGELGGESYLRSRLRVANGEAA